MEVVMAKHGQSDQWQDWVLNSLPMPRMEANEPVTSLTPAPTTTMTADAPFSSGPQLQPHFDPIELLPPAAQERLRKLRQRSADAHALIPAFEDVHEASTARVAAEHALKRLTDHPQDGGFNLAADNFTVVTAQRTLDKATDEFRRLQELQQVRSTQWQTASVALQAVEGWLRNGRPGNTTLEAVEIEPVRLLKGEGLVDAIERIRRRGRELKADLHRIDSAPFPSNYCKQRMRAQIEALAQAGTPDVTMLTERDREIGWPTQRISSQVIGGQERSLAFSQVPDTVALFAFVHKTALVDALDALIDAEADDAASLSHEQRRQAEAEAQGDLLDIERQEAALTWSAIEQGLLVEFRPDISPLAILGLRLVTVPRAAPPDSSAGHAGYNLIGGRR
jgi:hypothetical protein